MVLSLNDVCVRHYLFISFSKSVNILWTLNWITIKHVGVLSDCHMNIASLKNTCTTKKKSVNNNCLHE